uniref:Reverse transcriptase domain-containing protein n=1 Tax=Tanacetum cinerariifolium TaxID=118510 RepID=A0A6L2M3W9_TANCI|nr:hypothetical protein [Tanacetum cinerariifolium]
MANSPLDHNEFALAAEAAPDNMNAWVEWDEEDLEMEEKEEEMDVDANEEGDGPEWIIPYEGVDPLNPPPPASDSEYEIKKATPMSPPPIPVDHKAEAATAGTGRLVPLTGRRLFTNTQIEKDDVRAENNRLRIMLDCSENCIRTTRRELDRATWHYHQLRDPYVAARDAATVPATDDDDPATLSRIDAIGYDDLYNFIKQCNYVLTLLVMNNENGYLLIYYLIIMSPKATSQAAIERLITQRVNAALEAERARQGLTDNIKGAVISSKPTSLNEAVRMAHALMEQKA